METTVVLPIRSFRHGMSRLGSHFGVDRRRVIGHRVTGHVLAAVRDAGGIPLIVTDDLEVRAWAVGEGVRVVADPGLGLSLAAAAGVDSIQPDAPWVVLHSDLPLLDKHDVTKLLDAGRAGQDVIAPSSDGGTSALGSTGSFSFTFGPGSFHRHLGRLVDPRVIFRVGLALDIDQPRDLHSAMSSRRGLWLNDLINGP